MKTLIISIAGSLLIMIPFSAMAAGPVYYPSPSPPQVGDPPVYDAGIRAAIQNRLQDTDEWWRRNQRMKGKDWTRTRNHR
jgi:hypothetical protein